MVSESKPGILKFEGNGFTLNMSYNPRVVTPEIQFIEVTDRSLRKYWPNGVTRIKMKYNKQGLKGEESLIFTPQI